MHEFIILSRDSCTESSVVKYINVSLENFLAKCTFSATAGAAKIQQFDQHSGG